MVGKFYKILRLTERGRIGCLGLPSRDSFG